MISHDAGLRKNENKNCKQVQMAKNLIVMLWQNCRFMSVISYIWWKMKKKTNKTNITILQLAEPLRKRIYIPIFFFLLFVAFFAIQQRGGVTEANKVDPCSPWNSPATTAE